MQSGEVSHQSFAFIPLKIITCLILQMIYSILSLCACFSRLYLVIFDDFIVHQLQ